LNVSDEQSETSSIRNIYEATTVQADTEEVRGILADCPSFVMFELLQKIPSYSFTFNPHRMPGPHCPRLLLHGAADMGQTSHIGLHKLPFGISIFKIKSTLAPAVLNELEKYPVYTLDLAALYSDGGVRSCEEAFLQV
jgi:hypothetical protein